MDDEELDLSWAEEQIARARVPVSVGNAILTLLRVWGTLDFRSENQQNQTLDLFSQLARSEALEKEDSSKWIPVQVGFMVNVGDTVRVRRDAFTGDTGKTHNGRVGRVVAKRSGDIIVRSSDDLEPFLDGTHYPPSTLELKIS